MTMLLKLYIQFHQRQIQVVLFVSAFVNWDYKIPVNLPIVCVPYQNTCYTRELPKTHVRLKFQHPHKGDTHKDLFPPVQSFPLVVAFLHSSTTEMLLSLPMLQGGVSDPNPMYKQPFLKNSFKKKNFAVCLRSEDNCKSVLSLRYISLREQIQVIQAWQQALYPTEHSHQPEVTIFLSYRNPKQQNNILCLSISVMVFACLHLMRNEMGAATSIIWQR